MTPDAELMLGKLRCAVLRAKLFAGELKEIGLALKHGMITPSGAVAWVHKIGGASWLSPPPELLEVLPDKTGTEG
jgi:hypothetical protein